MMTGEARVTDFNPRSPHGERLICVLCMFNFKRYFNPRSPHGERHVCRASSPANVNFNPRSPHGERLELVPISAAKPDFNPRSPHGERPYCLYHLALSSLFQSTLPARGATSGVGDPLFNWRISIHAPRTGSDYHARKAALLTYAFQSTLPARGATWYRDATRTDEGDFNPRSPHGERHGWMLRPQTVDDFNPRSPHGERPNGLRARRAKLDFNPRSPHGERHCKAPRLSPRGTFQSTLPARGATRAPPPQSLTFPFQSTLPARGATPPLTGGLPSFLHFNPRSPHGERPALAVVAQFSRRFQSTLPARGATSA